MADIVRISLDDDVEKKPRQKKPAKKVEPGKIERLQDLERIVDDFENTFREQTQIIGKIQKGLGFSDAQAAIDKLITTLSSGPHIDFYKRYSFMADEKQREEFIDTDDDVLLRGDRRQMYIFFKVMQKTEKLREELLEYMKTMMDGVVITYSAVRLLEKVKPLYTIERQRNLEGAFSQFHQVYRQYSRMKYDDLGITEFTVGLDEAKEQVLKKMSRSIYNTDFLCLFLDDVHTIKPEAYNLLNMYDNVSTEFGSIVNLVSMTEGLRDTANKLWEELFDLKASNGTYENFWNGYFDGMSDFAFEMKMSTQKGLDILKDFTDRKKNENPYTFMYVGKMAQQAISECKLQPITDIAHNGSNYVQIFQSMLSRLDELAGEVAKTAIH